LKVSETIKSVRSEVGHARAISGGRVLVGFVPTMGALHAGHMSLVDAARRDCEFVVVSIFVNPTQFGPGEDYEQYPRPLQVDLAKCLAAGVDLVFAPTNDEMYATKNLTSVNVARVSATLCGSRRPGHFEGVCLVVAKLLNIIQADRAYFGQKDAQQAAVIRQMVWDLSMPVEILACPIVREPDGLALSSRNSYLQGPQREQAAVLHRSLQQIAHDVEGGQRSVDKIVLSAKNLIEAAGPCRIDYVELVDPETMQPVDRINGPVLAVLAVRIGECRLIDNLLVDGSVSSG